MSAVKFPVETRGVVNFAQGFMILPAEGVSPGRSRYPNYKDTYVSTLAVPMYGSDFYEYLIEMGENGATMRSIKEDYEFFIYVLKGAATLRIEDSFYEMPKGSYVYLPPDTAHSIDKVSVAPFNFLMIKRKYIPAGSERPKFIYGNEKDVPEETYALESTVGNLTRLLFMPIPEDDPVYDMSVYIAKLKPGAGLPFLETHYQHHGIYVLSGTGMWYLGNKWHHVKAGDFIWTGQFAPCTVWCNGPTQVVYLLYKNWNR